MMNMTILTLTTIENSILNGIRNSDLIDFNCNAII